MMSWEGFGKKQLWSNQDNFLAVAQTNGGNSRKTRLGWLMFQLRCESST
jgi:hypothetical protein